MKATLRSPDARDFKLISDSWQKSFLGMSREKPHGTGPLAAMNTSEYFREQSEVIDAILGRPETDVLVACWNKDRNLILGWVCGAPSRRVLHFLYVNHLYRREGYGSQLMNGLFTEVGKSPLTVTHWTRVLPHYRLRWKLEYNPYELFRVV